MQRRSFFSWFGLGLFANFLPMLLSACGSSQAKVKVTNKGFRAIGKVSTLDREAQILDRKLADSPVLAVRHPAKSDTIVAVKPICTHRNCLVDWASDRHVFVCACHDSEFDTEGTVLSGPATEPLVTYTVKLEKDAILVSDRPSTNSSNIV
jgi:cytochrome b6-f complex iron-sulfur subunit